MINNEVNKGDGKKIQEYTNAFERFDKNYDGYISLEDLAEIMKKVGKPIEKGEMLDLVADFKPNDNGMFDLKEYLSIMERRNRDKNGDDDLFTIFKIIDVDKNDLIGSEELLKYMTSLGHVVSEEEAEEMIKEYDCDGDGYCTFKEFVKMIKFQSDNIEEEDFDKDSNKD